MVGTWITHRPGHAASAARWQCALCNAWPVARILSERDSWIAAAITGSPHHTGACDAFSESVATTGDAGDRHPATFDPPGTTPSGAPLRMTAFCLLPASKVIDHMIVWASCLPTLFLIVKRGGTGAVSTHKHNAPYLSYLVSYDDDFSSIRRSKEQALN